jgi:hypothetical protein
MGILMLGHVSKVQRTIKSCIRPELENWTKATVTIFLCEVLVSIPLNKIKKKFNKFWRKRFLIKYPTLWEAFIQKLRCLPVHLKKLRLINCHVTGTKIIKEEERNLMDSLLCDRRLPDHLLSCLHNPKSANAAFTVVRYAKTLHVFF